MNRSDFFEDWSEERPDGWFRRMVRRGGRPSAPVVAVICGLILMALIAVVLLRPSGSPPPPKSNPVAMPTAGEAPSIEFAPVGEGEILPSTSESETPLPQVTGTSGVPVTHAPAITPTTGAAPPPSVPPGQPPAPPQQITFAAVAGPGCGQDSAKGYHSNGYYSDGYAGWYTRSTGSWTGDGCGGSFQAMPMSGSSTSDDPTTYAEWFFAFNPAIKTCALAVYVPTTGTPRDVAGNPAYYQLRDTESGAVKRTFTVTQKPTGNWAKWTPSADIAVTGGRLVVRAVNRGLDWENETSTYAHIAISAIRVACHS